MRVLFRQYGCLRPNSCSSSVLDYSARQVSSGCKPSVHRNSTYTDSNPVTRDPDEYQWQVPSGLEMLPKLKLVLATGQCTFPPGGPITLLPPGDRNNCCAYGK